jgi:hypothetical protein
MSDFWDREVVERRHMEWMALLPVRLHINELIGGGTGRLWRETAIKSTKQRTIFFLSLYPIKAAMFSIPSLRSDRSDALRFIVRDADESPQRNKPEYLNSHALRR